MKKICKVVINSVSHDARVVKQATSLKSAGYDVSIIGIQDAKNEVPFEVTKEGIKIYRVAWRSKAIIPTSFFFTFSILGILSLTFATIFSVNFAESTISNFNFILPEFINFDLGSIWKPLAYVVVFILAILFVYKVYNDYQASIGSYTNVRKKEDEVELKYNLEGIERIFAEEKKFSDNFIWLTPRILALGFGGLLNVNTSKMFRAIFARESKISEILDEIKPDIVHAHDVYALPVASQFKKRGKSKLVFDAHELYDHLAQSNREHSHLNKFLLKKYSKSVDMFITINESFEKYYSIAYPKFPPAIVIKNAAKISEKFRYDGRLHDAAGIDRKKKILLYQGGFADKRGLQSLLLSANYLQNDWQLVFMGWGNFKVELDKTLELMKLKNNGQEINVKFVKTAPQEELPLWTSGATVGVIPYENSGLNHWYCTPNKLWEYPNAGVPILGSPFPEIRKVVEGHEVGWLLPDPLEPKQIAEIVNNLEIDEISQASKNCKKYMKNDNWSVYEKRLLKGYRELNGK